MDSVRADYGGISGGDAKPTERSHLAELASGIDRFEKNLAVLETRVQPVLSQHGARIDVESRPEEEPEHDLAAQVKRLRLANEAFEHTIDLIHL